MSLCWLFSESISSPFLLVWRYVTIKKLRYWSLVEVWEFIRKCGAQRSVEFSWTPNPSPLITCLRGVYWRSRAQKRVGKCGLMLTLDPEKVSSHLKPFVSRKQNTVVNAGRNKLRIGHQAIHQTNNFLTNNGHGWIEVSFVITLGSHVYKIFNDLGPDFLFVSLNKLINISLYDKLKQKCNLIGSYAWSITGQMQRWRHH